MKKEKLDLAHRWMTDKSQLIIKNCKYLYEKKIGQTSLLVWLLLSFGVLLLIGSYWGVIGQTVNYEDLHRGVIHYNDQIQEVVTNSQTVAEVLEEFNIHLSNLDVVTPDLQTPIQNNDFEIIVQTGYYVQVLDKDQEIVTIVTVQTDPRKVVEDLGYRLGPYDQAIWGDYQITKQLVMARTLSIARNHQYSININGQLSQELSEYDVVEDILLDLGYSIENITYIHPQLDEVMTNPDQTIVVYYNQPNQKIKTEIHQFIDNNHLIDQERVYLVTSNINQELIHQKEINRLLLKRSDQPTDLDLTNLTDQHQRWLLASGINPVDWVYVDYILEKESSWRYWVWNQQGSSAYGLCQALPFHRMGSHGSDYMTNPVTQLKWCDWYAKDRYKSWQKAYEAWKTKYWW